jgi:hypothetical protein
MEKLPASTTRASYPSLPAPFLRLPDGPHRVGARAGHRTLTKKVWYMFTRLPDLQLASDAAVGTSVHRNFRMMHTQNPEFNSHRNPCHWPTAQFSSR